MTEDGVALTGEGGLLTDLMRHVLQNGLEVEMAEHLGYERGQTSAAWRGWPFALGASEHQNRGRAMSCYGVFLRSQIEDRVCTRGVGLVGVTVLSPCERLRLAQRGRRCATEPTTSVCPTPRRPRSTAYSLRLSEPES
jgi:hypothetical protein